MNVLVNSYLSKRKKIILILPFLIFSFIACYFRTFSGLLSIWLHNGDYSYALLIPFISGYLIWEKRMQISQTKISINWFGGLSFFLFLIISIYGIFGSSPSAVRPAIPFIILSITLFCFGKEMFKILFFPLSLLIFMIPLPTIIEVRIGMPLKIISTRLGEFILRLFRISVFVEGNIIDLGVTKLQVVDACSGLRYLLPLFLIGILFAYFFEKNRIKQIILIFLTIPISIITNGFRIGLTGVLAEYCGSKVADGFFHGFSGWLIFMFAFFILFIFHLIINFLSRWITKKDNNYLKPESNEKIEKLQKQASVFPILMTTLCFLLVAILSHTASALPSFIIKNGIINFPLTLNDWKGRSESIGYDMTILSGAEDVFNANYINERGDSIDLYIGYRGSPFFENENFFHSPHICLPSSGWKTLSLTTHNINNIPQFNTITVSRMFVEKMGVKYLVYFWFQTKNRISYDVNINRFHLALHALFRDNTHDLFIRLITPVKSNEQVKYTENRLDSFCREMMNFLLNYLEKNQIEKNDAI